MSDIWTMGEILVEVMRPKCDMPLYKTAEFLGPYPSGAPAIFIDTVARLGHGAAIIGGIGDDDFGKCLMDRLNNDGVSCDNVIKGSGSTAVAFVTYSQDGSRKFIFHIENTPAVMAEGNSANTNGAKFFHVMGCSLMSGYRLREAINKTASRFYETGAKISFDPNIRPELLGNRNIMDIIGSIIERTSVLLPGADELKLITGTDSIDSAVSKAFMHKNLELLVLKQGKKGCEVFSKDGKHLKAAAYKVEEVDPTGAGDCFDAGFLCGLLEGLSLEGCAKKAAAAGALNAAAFGPMEGAISPQNIKTMIGL